LCSQSRQLSTGRAALFKALCVDLLSQLAHCALSHDGYH
jgi:hypothetical protein